MIDQKREIFTPADTMTAICMFGNLTEHLPFFLSADGLTTLQLLAYDTLRGESAKNTDDLEQQDVIDHALHLQEKLRNTIKNTLTPINEEEAKLASFNTAVESMKTSNEPHLEGTVADLALEYGVSKSEIRRRKRDNTLNELIFKNDEDDS